MFFTIRFILSWTLWILLADKSRWRGIFPACLLASYLGFLTDILMDYYLLWEYTGIENPVFIKFSANFEVFIIVTYLFIQWLPAKQTLGRMFWYWFIWTSITTSIEAIHVMSGHMHYHQWWSMWHSYFADWFLFWVFYKIHKVFRLEMLN